ncbi:MAG: GFA family protein [Zoogloeaceae bacterium]|nr:GFA family protein [Zoogloeaceae bacterium]
MSDTEVSGSCLCGSVKLSAEVKDRVYGACHCGICRKWGGGPMLAVECAQAPTIEGAEHIRTFDSSEWAERGFCGKCGTHLFYRLKAQDFYALSVGLLEDTDWRFEHQVFIDEKPAHYAFANRTHDLTGAEVFAQFGASPD